ncbi:MAG: hypothetical protein L0956_10350, partial [Candidatus Mariimomonas ferrooxydans]
FLYGCGSGGIGGMGGQETGILIATSFSVESPNLDAAIHFCDVEQTDPEDGLFDNFATMTITAELINPGYDTFPARVTQCRITYLKANEDPASPIIQSWDRFPNCVFTADTTGCGVDLIDIDRKAKWWSDYSSGLNDPAELPANYVAFYECEYDNKWGDSENFEGRISFRLDDYDVC